MVYSIPSHINVTSIILKTAGGEKFIGVNILHEFHVVVFLVSKLSVQGSTSGDKYFDLADQGIFKNPFIKRLLIGLKGYLL